MAILSSELLKFMDVIRNNDQITSFHILNLHTGKLELNKSVESSDAREWSSERLIQEIEYRIKGSPISKQDLKIIGDIDDIVRVEMLIVTPVYSIKVFMIYNNENTNRVII